MAKQYRIGIAYKTKPVGAGYAHIDKLYIDYLTSFNFLKEAIMAAAMKIILRELASNHPHISALELATIAVNDHIARNGCEFELNAAAQAIYRAGVDPEARTETLSNETLMSLGDTLEAMETNCPHKN